MSDNPNNADNLQPSWAAHELFALGLTLLLALWITVKYGGNTAPADHRDARAAKRATKRAELAAADEKALGSYGVVNADLNRYRLPIINAMSIVVDKAGADPKGISVELASRLVPQVEASLVEIKAPASMGDESELNDAALIAQGKALFLSKICFTCHQTDPAVPAPAGLALKAPKFIGKFWGEERLVQLDKDPTTLPFEPSGQFEKVKLDPGYFYESVKTPNARVLQGSVPGMAPLPVTDAEIKALMAYVKSLSQ